jgi:integral membrane protein (TIGR01906 family)
VTTGSATTAGTGRDPDRGHPLTRAVVAVATALVVVGIAIALFFNPAWVGFAQARANAAAFTGWTPAQVEAVTADIVAEVWLGPGTFAQDVGGQPVFEARERSHMADVRRVVLSFYLVVAVAAAALVALGLRSRGAAWFWGAVGTGAKVLAVGTVAVGLAFALLFDTAFTIFHELFFAAGTWTFDPATDRLVQLFPYQFWTETSVAIAVVVLALAIVTWLLARRLAGRVAAKPAPAGAPVADGPRA